MPSTVTTCHDLAPVSFGHAWCNADGFSQGTVRLGSATVLCTLAEDADAAAEAFHQCADAMRKLDDARRPTPQLAVMNAHALIIEPAQGDDWIARCACGDLLGDEGPTTNWNHFAGPWNEHLARVRAAQTPAAK